MRRLIHAVHYVFHLICTLIKRGVGRALIGTSAASTAPNLVAFLAGAMGRGNCFSYRELSGHPAAPHIATHPFRPAGRR